MSKRCEMCGGSGFVFATSLFGRGDKDTCPECGGRGIVESVTAPAGKREEASTSKDKDNCRCPGFIVIGNNCGICPHCQNQAMNKRDAAADLAMLNKTCSECDGKGAFGSVRPFALCTECGGTGRDEPIACLEIAEYWIERAEHLEADNEELRSKLVTLEAIRRGFR